MRTKKNKPVQFVVENIDIDSVLGKKKRAKKIMKESVMKIDEPKAKRGRPRKNKIVDEKPIRAKHEKINRRPKSVKKIERDEKPANPIKDMKPLINESKDIIRKAENACKKWAKIINKFDNDEMKQHLIEKLVKAGFSFGVDDPTKLVVEINVGCTISPKLKKLRNGAKAVEKKAVAVVDEPKTENIEQPNENPVVEPKPIEQPIEQPNEQPIEQPNETADCEMKEIPVGDTYSDERIDGPSDAELDVIEAEESADEQPNGNDDDLVSYRAEFFNNMAENGDLEI